MHICNFVRTCVLYNSCSPYVLHFHGVSSALYDLHCVNAPLHLPKLKHLKCKNGEASQLLVSYTDHKNEKYGYGLGSEIKSSREFWIVVGDGKSKHDKSNTRQMDMSHLFGSYILSFRLAWYV